MAPRFLVPVSRRSFATSIGRSRPLAVLCACSLALAACGGAEDPDVLASWDGGDIRRAEFDGWVSSLPEEKRAPEDGTSLEEWVADGLRSVAFRRELERRALEAGLDGTSDVRMQVRLATNIELGKELVRRRCPAEPADEAALRRAYDAAYPATDRPWILVRHIFKRVPPGADRARREQVRAELAAIRAQLEDGANFIELARRSSESATARDGGLIGRISRQAPMDPEFLDAAWSLADGELSDIVALRDGFHLILRESSGVEEPTPFEEAMPTLRRQLVQRQRELCGRRILSDLARETPVRLPDSLPVQPAPDSPLLWIGDEEFTVDDLDAVDPSGSGVGASPQVLGMLRQFAEAELLGREARKDEELAARAESLSAALGRRRAIEAQLVEEKRQAVEGWPEERLRQYFEEHSERFATERTLDLGLILLPSEAEGSERETIAAAFELKAEAESGRPFEELAREHSQHPSAAEGGRLGALPWSRVRALFGGEALQSIAVLEIGAVSEPLLITRQPARVYGVVKLYDRVEPRPRSFAEVRDEVVAAATEDQARPLTDEAEENVLAQVGFRLHEDAVESFAAALLAPAGGAE